MRAGVARFDHECLEQLRARRLGIPPFQGQQARARKAHVVVAGLGQRGVETGTGICQAQALGRGRGLFPAIGGVVGRERHGARQGCPRGPQVATLLQRTPEAPLCPGLLRIALGAGGRVAIEGHRRVASPLESLPVGIGQQQFHRGGRCGARRVEPGTRVAAAIERHEQVRPAGGDARVRRALPGDGQAALGGVELPVEDLQVREHQVRDGPALGGGQGLKACPGADPLAASQIRPHGCQRRRDGHALELRPPRHISRIGHHPLHALARAYQHALDGRPAGLRDALLGRSHLHAAQWVRQLHHPRQHGQRRAPAGLHLHVPVRASHHRHGGGGLQLQRGWGLLGAGPQAPGDQFQQRARGL